MYSLSIILPCYNVAQYIERAVNSILAQDFSDYEVIIVNDGSPDNLLEICERNWGGNLTSKSLRQRIKGCRKLAMKGWKQLLGNMSVLWILMIISIKECLVQ